jgi:hypothetical protein
MDLRSPHHACLPFDGQGVVSCAATPGDQHAPLERCLCATRLQSPSRDAALT